MKDQETSVVFDPIHASSYDKQFAKLAPVRDALNLLIRMVLSELPVDARILCIGVGTGRELIDLAQAFPQWRFTAIIASSGFDTPVLFLQSLFIHAWYAKRAS